MSDRDLTRIRLMPTGEWLRKAAERAAIDDEGSVYLDVFVRCNGPVEYGTAGFDGAVLCGPAEAT
jgi:hypothetical protein